MPLVEGVKCFSKLDSLLLVKSLLVVAIEFASITDAKLAKEIEGFKVVKQQEIVFTRLQYILLHLCRLLHIEIDQ